MDAASHRGPVGISVGTLIAIEHGSLRYRYRRSVRDRIASRRGDKAERSPDDRRAAYSSTGTVPSSGHGRSANLGRQHVSQCVQRTGILTNTLLTVVSL